MKTEQKIEKKGYKVTYNLGYKNGEQGINSVTATKNNVKLTAKNITALLKSI